MCWIKRNFLNILFPFPNDWITIPTKYSNVQWYGAYSHVENHGKPFFNYRRKKNRWGFSISLYSLFSSSLPIWHLNEVWYSAEALCINIYTGSAVAAEGCSRVQGWVCVPWRPIACAAPSHRAPTSLGSWGRRFCQEIKMGWRKKEEGRQRTHTTQRNGFQMTLISVSLTHRRSCPRTNQRVRNLIKCSTLRMTQNNKCSQYSWWTYIGSGVISQVLMNLYQVGFFFLGKTFFFLKLKFSVWYAPIYGF